MNRPHRGSWGTDWSWRDRGKWAWHNLVPLTAVALAFWSVLGVQRAVDETAREGAERRDQICLSAEREHLNDVTSLTRTYEYLGSLTRGERMQPLNRFLIRSLPEAENKVRIDPAPPFCDEPDVGLPEPDPRIPHRPAELVG